MAHSIPRTEWSEAEAHRERIFHWQYLVDTWLVPGPAVLTEPDELPPSWSGATTRTLHKNGWLLEPKAICEQ